MKIISLVNHKGGVGKTTSTLNLGKALALAGKKVLLVDIDPQANLSQSVGIQDPECGIYQTLCDNTDLAIHPLSERLHIVPTGLELATAEMKLHGEQVSGFLKLKKAFKRLPQKFDFVLVDCPPSLGILTINALLASTDFLVIAEPEYLSITGLQTILDLVERLRDDLNPDLHWLGILFAQVGRTTVNKGIIKAIQDNHGDKVLTTHIRENVKLAEASLARKDIFDYDASSLGAQDYATLAQEIIKHYQKR